MPRYYSPDQLMNIVPFLPRKPKWFILGGPANGNEAQAAHTLWAGVKILGVEPNREAIHWQKNNLWPSPHLLLNYALADTCGRLTQLVLESGKLANASIDPESVEVNKTNSMAIYETVETITLDRLDEIYGPFEDAVVWMDIEGSEYKALLGAEKLLERKAVMLWNVEMQNRVPGLMEGIPRLLRDYKAVKDWNDSESCRDRIFVLSE